MIPNKESGGFAIGGGRGGDVKLYSTGSRGADRTVLIDASVKHKHGGNRQFHVCERNTQSCIASHNGYTQGNKMSSRNA